MAQAVRFRLFRYEDGKVPEEVVPNGDLVGIRWRVDVANRKAAFFNFVGPIGKRSLYGSLHWLPFLHRNRRVRSSDRETLLVQSAQRTEITSRDQGKRVCLINQNQATCAAIPELGELRVDEQGRLIFCGGYGRTAYLPALNHGRPRHETLRSYANNDGWFDDVCDGPVSAILTFADGTTVPVEGLDGAWVLVAPPDFAPAVLPVRSMWDTLIDRLVRTRKGALEVDPTFRCSKWHMMAKHWDSGRSRLAGYCPSFRHDILPILDAAADIAGVFSMAAKPVAHRRFDPSRLAMLAHPGGDRAQRLAVFARLRPPNHREYDESLMPLAHGDAWPLVSGGMLGWLSKIAATLSILPRPLLTLSELQYAILASWAEGTFRNDFDPNAPFGDTAQPRAADLTPLDLDRAALQAASGGAFFPGIEASWLLQDDRVHAAPLRLAAGKLLRRWTALGPLTIGPGFLTAQMALPWQADFASCRKTYGPSGKNFVGWWPSQRPDDVLLSDRDKGTLRPRRWAPEIDALNDDVALHQKMVDDWWKQDFVIYDEQVGLHLQSTP